MLITGLSCRFAKNSLKRAVWRGAGLSINRTADGVVKSALGLFLSVAVFVHPAFSQEQTASSRNVYFGELHIHSGWSFDSAYHGVLATPEDAYRYNSGIAISHPSGEVVQANQPLDFMALTDHSEYMGFMPLFSDKGHPLSKTGFARRINSEVFEERLETFLTMTGQNPEKLPKFGEMGEETLRNVWRHYVDLANQYYQPGKFTTFTAYEWSAQDIHRNVIFEGSDVPEKPYSSLDSLNPEDLWDWLDVARSKGSDVLAIPHNANISNGLMFDDKQWAGESLTAEYAAQRMRNEPLVEITQIKGTSETIGSLSPTDEWANFEILDTLIGRPDKLSDPQGSYVRQAYKDGLKMQREQHFNPYQFGLIGSSDGHNATSPIEENNFTGKLGRLDATAEKRRGGNPLHPVSAKYSASGLAGVWAEENSRESIFQSLKRKEVFATSGPRIQIRFFAGWTFDNKLLGERNWEPRLYREGVPMGSELMGSADSRQSPVFFVQAVKDPASTWLQRAQVVKGWVTKEGESREKVFDVLCSDGAAPDQQTYRCPDNGAKVDLASCDVSRNVGDVELAGLWQDPEFDADQSAFYYLRVLENPTCRWSTWDAIRNGYPLKEEVPATIQERAWSSPIWYKTNR